MYLSPQAGMIKSLTARQEELLGLIGDGCSDREISKILFISESTVRAHVHQNRQKLGLENRAQMIAYANRQQKSMK